MSQLNFWQHLQFQVKYAPVSETDDDLEKWKKRSQVIDNEVEKSGISNPTFVKIAKDRLLGQRPPTYSALENIAEDLPTGFARGTYGSFTKSVGAGLSAPRASVMDDLQPFFDKGIQDEVTGEMREYTQEEKEEFATKYLSNELPHPFIPTFLSPKRKDIYDRPEKPEWLQELGTNLYEHGKEFRERWQGEGRAATNEEYIRKAYSPSGDIVEKLFAKAIQRGWVNSPSELARSTGESVASLGAGVTAGTAGFLAGGPRGAAAGFMAGATMQASLQVADGVGESVENDEEIKKLVEQTVLQKYTTEQLANEDIRDKVKEETDDKMNDLGKFWTSETIQRRLGSPAALIDLIGAYPLGNIVARAILDTGAEAGSEAYDTALEETIKLNAKEDLLQELGVPQSEIDEVLNYETIAGLRINDWMKVVRGGTAGAILGAGTTAPTIAIEEAGKLAVNTLKKSSDPRIDPDRTARKTLRDQEMIDTKEEAYVEQVRLQGLDAQVKGLDAEAKAETARLNAEREKEKTEQERIKARLKGYLEGDPKEQLALDQQVETTSDQVMPDLPDMPDEFGPSSTAEDIRVSSELTPEEVREEEDRWEKALKFYDDFYMAEGGVVGLSEPYKNDPLPGYKHYNLTAVGENIGRVILRKTEDNFDVLHLEISPEWRGKGLGFRWLEQEITKAKSQGIDSTLQLTHNPNVIKWAQEKGGVLEGVNEEQGTVSTITFPVKDETTQVDPRLAPQPETAPDERAQLEQSILDDFASYDAEYRETGVASQVSEDEAGNTTLRSASSAQDRSDKNLEAIPSPISQNESRDSVHRNTKATTEAVVKLFARRFPKLGLKLGENVLILTDNEYRRYLDSRAVEQGRLDDITVQGVEDFAQELSRASDYVPGTEGHYEKDTGRVVLNVDNISAAGEQRNASDRLVEVLWHEALGHKGLIEGLNDASTDGKGYNRFINAFLDSYQDDPVFNAYVSEVGLEDNRFGAAEEFIVQKFREGNVFNLDEEGNLYESIDTGENRFSQGSLENKFLDSLVASFKAAIGRDGVNKGRLDDRQIRHIMLALKLKNMGQNVLGRRPVISFEDQDDFILESDPSDQTVTKETTDADGNTILHSLDSKLPEGYRDIKKFRHATGKEWRWEFNLPPTKGRKKDRTFQIRAFRAKATSDTVGGASTFTAFDDKTGVATESKPLYEVDPEFKSKIDAANIDPNNENAYVFDFGKLNPRSGKISYLRTKEGSEKEIMSQVVSFLKEFLGDVRPQQLIYTGKEETEDSVEGKVPAINRLYTRINQRMADEFSYPQNVEHLYNGDLEGIFILQDAPAEAEGQAAQESVPPTPEVKRVLDLSRQAEENLLRSIGPTVQEQEAILRSAARTPEFRKFFRGNKLTADLMGGNPNEPLMVYHGAKGGFEGVGFKEKDRSRVEPPLSDERGSEHLGARERREPFIYVTTSKRLASGYGGRTKRGVVLPLYARIRKPFVFTAKAYNDWAEQKFGVRPMDEEDVAYSNAFLSPPSKQDRRYPHDVIYRIAQHMWRDAYFFQGILDQGYDGAIFEGSSSQGNDHIALVLPQNLKSQWNVEPEEGLDLLRSAPQKFKRNWYGDEGLYDPSYVSEVKTEELKGDTGEVLGTKEVPQFESGIDFTIPDESEEGLLYRGMSDGEYQEFVKTGEVKSAGSYNIGEQAGLTYYSTSIQSAEAYADRFAPSQFKASFEKPAYVVAINAPDTKYTRHVEGVGEHEVGVSIPIPSKDIVAIYKGEVIEHRPGTEGEGISIAPSSKLSWKKIFDQRSQKPLGREPVEEGALDLPDAPPGFWEKADSDYDSLFTEEKASQRLKYVHDLINKTLSDGGDTFANEIGENNTIDHENYIADLRVFSSEPVTGSDRLTGEEKKINPATALYMQTKTPKFRKFYRGSRLVNTDKKSPNYNKPIMLFHGTFEWEGKGFKNKFRGRSTQGLAGAVGTGLNTGGILGHGFYFTSNLNVAESYATTDWNPSGEGGFIIPAYVSIQNPLEVQSRHPLIRTRATASIKPAIGTEISGTDALKLIVAAKNIGVDLGLADTQAVFKEKWKPLPALLPFDKGLLNKQIVSLGDMIELFSAYNADISSIVQRAGFDGIIEYGSENRGLKEPIYNPALKEEVPDIQQVIVYDSKKIKSVWNLTPQKSGDLLRSYKPLRTLKSVPGDSRPLNSKEVDEINDDLQSLLRSASNRIKHLRRVRWSGRPEEEKKYFTSTGKKYSLHRLHDRVEDFTIVDTPDKFSFDVYARILDIVGGKHDFHFEANYSHMDPMRDMMRTLQSESSEVSGVPTNEEVFELRQSDNPPWRDNPTNNFQREVIKVLERGFSFKRMHDAWNVVFKIDDSFDILNHEISDHRGDNRVNAQVNRPAWSAMNNALIAFIETAKPAFLQFSAQERSRVRLYSNHMSQIGEVYGYGVYSLGSDYSKNFFMQKLWDTEEEYYLNNSKVLNIFVPNHPNYKAFSNLEITELAQLGTNIEKLDERRAYSPSHDPFAIFRDFSRQAELPLGTPITTENIFKYFFNDILDSAPSFKDGVLRINEIGKEIEEKKEEYGPRDKGADNFNAHRLHNDLIAMARYLNSFQNDMSLIASRHQVNKDSENAHQLLTLMAVFGRTSEVKNIQGRPQTSADVLYNWIKEHGFPKATYTIFRDYINNDGSPTSGWGMAKKIIDSSDLPDFNRNDHLVEIHSFVRNLQNLGELNGVVDVNAALNADAVYETEDFLDIPATTYGSRTIQYDGEKDRFLLLDFSEDIEGKVLGKIAFMRPEALNEEWLSDDWDSLGGEEGWSSLLQKSNTSHYKPKLGQPLTLDSFIDFLTAKTDQEIIDNNPNLVSPIFSAPIEETIQVIDKISRVQGGLSRHQRGLSSSSHFSLILREISENISYDQLLGVLHYDTSLLLGLPPESSIYDISSPHRVQPTSLEDSSEEARERLNQNLRGEFQPQPETLESASTRYPYRQEDAVIARKRAIIENIRDFLIADSNSYRITESDAEILATARPDLQREIIDGRNRMRFTTAARMGEEAIAEEQEARRSSANRIILPKQQEFIRKLMPYFKTPPLTENFDTFETLAPHDSLRHSSEGYMQMLQFRSDARNTFARIRRLSPNISQSPEFLINLWFAIQFAKHGDFKGLSRTAHQRATDIRQDPNREALVAFDPESDKFVTHVDDAGLVTPSFARITQQEIADDWNNAYDQVKENSNNPIFKYLNDMLASADPDDVSWVKMLQGDDLEIEKPLTSFEEETIRDQDPQSSLHFTSTLIDAYRERLSKVSWNISSLRAAEELTISEGASQVDPETLESVINFAISDLESPRMYDPIAKEFIPWAQDWWGFSSPAFISQIPEGSEYGSQTNLEENLQERIDALNAMLARYRELGFDDNRVKTLLEIVELHGDEINGIDLSWAERIPDSAEGILIDLGDDTLELEEVEFTPDDLTEEELDLEQDLEETTHALESVQDDHIARTFAVPVRIGNVVGRSTSGSGGENNFYERLDRTEIIAFSDYTNMSEDDHMYMVNYLEDNTGSEIFTRGGTHEERELSGLRAQGDGELLSHAATRPHDSDFLTGVTESSLLQRNQSRLPSEIRRGVETLGPHTWNTVIHAFRQLNESDQNYANRRRFTQGIDADKELITSIMSAERIRGPSESSTWHTNPIIGRGLWLRHRYFNFVIENIFKNKMRAQEADALRSIPSSTINLDFSNSTPEERSEGLSFIGAVNFYSPRSSRSLRTASLSRLETIKDVIAASLYQSTKEFYAYLSKNESNLLRAMYDGEAFASQVIGNKIFAMLWSPKMERAAGAEQGMRDPENSLLQEPDGWTPLETLFLNIQEEEGRGLVPVSQSNFEVEFKEDLSDIFNRARREGRQQNNANEDLAILRSVRRNLPLTRLDTESDTENKLSQSFKTPDGDKIHIDSNAFISTPLAGGVLDSKELEDAGTRAGLNIYDPMNVWNINFNSERNGPDIIGEGKHIHRIANGVKQFLGRLVEQKNPDVIKLSAFDPSFILSGSRKELRLNDLKRDSRISVYKFAAQQIGRDYGYKLFLRRKNWDAGLIVLQRKELTVPKLRNIVEEYNHKTGENVSWDSLRNWQRSFSEITESYLDSEYANDRELPPYNVLKLGLSKEAKKQLTKLHDAIPEFMRGTYKKEITNFVINDIAGKKAKEPTGRLQNTILRSRENKPLHSSEFPSVDRTMRSLKAKSGEPETAFGRWATNVMNYLKGKHLGNLEEEDKYLIGRYRALGKVAEMTEMGERFYKAFKDARYTKEIYEFLTTKGADPAMIPDDTERKNAIDAKEKIIRIGEDLADLGMLPQSTLTKLKGQYLPRIYLTHLLKDETVKALQGGGRPSTSQLDYLKHRRDIPKAVRELLLREIKDPDYLVGRALMIPGRDIALMNWYSDLAQNPKWAYQESVVEFDTLKEVQNIIRNMPGVDSDAVMKLFELDPSIEDRRNSLKERIRFVQSQITGTKDKDLKEVLRRDLANLKDSYKLLTPRKVSGEYLVNEAARIRKDILPTLDGQARDIGSKLTQRMDTVGEEHKKEDYDQRYWRKMPNTKRFGRLRGMIVRREIYDDIVGSQKIVQNENPDLIDEVFGEGGYVERAGQLWKWSKVAGNFPPSHVRNFTSNMILMHLGGVPGASLPGLLVKAVRELSTDGEHYRIAKRYGLKGSSFSANELGKIEKEFTELKRRLDKGKVSWLPGTLGALRRGFEGVKEATSKTYELMEALGKTMMIIDGVNRLKLSEEDAVIRAQKYLFDYSLLPGWARKVRRAALGAPFLTFYYKTLPVLIETMRSRPWKLAPYFLLGSGMQYAAKSALDLDDDEYEALKKSLPEWLRNKPHVYVLPWKDEHGRVQWVDGSYLMPWGMFSALLQEMSPVNLSRLIDITPDVETKTPSVKNIFGTLGLMTGPVPSTISATLTGVDPFTRRPIWNERDSAGDQVLSAGLYAYNLSMPTLWAGLPDLMLHSDQQRLQGGIRKLWGSARGELNNRGLPKDTIKQSWLRFGGINIYGFEPKQARKDSLFNMRRNLRDAQRDMRIEIRNMSQRGKTLDEISDRRSELMNRVKDEQLKLREYTAATRKVVNL